MPLNYFASFSRRAEKMNMVPNRFAEATAAEDGIVSCEWQKSFPAFQRLGAQESAHSRAAGAYSSTTLLPANISCKSS